MNLRLVLFPLVALLLVVAAACGDDDDEAATTSTTAAPTTTSVDEATTTTDDATTTTESDLEPVGSTGTDPVESDQFQEGPAAFLTDVRVAGHDGFDRIVFEFQDEVPGHRLELVGPPAPAGASGEPVQLRGEVFLQIHMAPAAGVDLSGAEAEPTYEGPSVITDDSTEVIVEVGQVEDFEANLIWAVGVEEIAPFAVASFEDPARLVVDIEVP